MSKKVQVSSVSLLQTGGLPIFPRSHRDRSHNIPIVAASNQVRLFDATVGSTPPIGWIDSWQGQLVVA